MNTSRSHNICAAICFAVLMLALVVAHYQHTPTTLLQRNKAHLTHVCESRGQRVVFYVSPNGDEHGTCMTVTP